MWTEEERERASSKFTEKSVGILTELLKGKRDKQVAYDTDSHIKTVERVRRQFPLFFGLGKARGKP